MKKAKTSKKSPRYRKTPSQKYSLGGDIGAGFAGAAKGIVGTVLPGPLGSMAMQGVDAIHGALDDDITNQEKAIAGYGQAAGAAGAAIVSGGALTGQAIGVGASGLSTGVANTGNGDDPNMQMLAQGINLAGQIGGMAYGNAQDKKLAEGGKLVDPPKDGVTYTNNPNSVDLAMYNDSLNLYNGYQQQLQNLGETTPQSWMQKPNPTKFARSPELDGEIIGNVDKHIEEAKIIAKLIADGMPVKEAYDRYPDSNYYSFKSKEDYIKSETASEFYDKNTLDENVKTIDYYDKLKFAYPTKTGYYTSTDLVHDRIMPTDTYYDGKAWNPRYKKPTKEVLYTGDEKLPYDSPYVPGVTTFNGVSKSKSKSPNYDTDLSASLKKQGRDRSFAARKKIAIEAGIDNYNGTVEQNIALLKAEKARGFDLSKPIKVEGFEKVEVEQNDQTKAREVEKSEVTANTTKKAIVPEQTVTPEAPIQTQEVQQNRGDQVQYNQVITGYKQVFNPETRKNERTPVYGQQGSRVRGAKINNNPNATTQYAEGGQMQQNMNNGQEQLNQFNGGGTHEENPVGGIPMGNGQSVEEGETELTSENYVFSDRLKSNKVLAEEFGYKHSDKTFAELSKSIDKKYSTRTSDSMDEESKKRELSRLMEAQEAMKEEKMQKDLAKFEKAQPELFAQMQAQAQQAAQGQGQPQQQQMPEGGMPQGMGQPGEMAMGGYRKNNDRQYAEGGPGDLGKLYQMYRKGIINKEQLTSYQEDLDMGVNFQTIFGQINYNQSKDTSEATPFTIATEAQQQSGQQPSQVNPMVTPGEEAQGSNTASPYTMAGGTGLDFTNENMSAADGTFTDGAVDSAVDSTVDGAADSGYQEPEGFKPGLANQVGQFAPIAYNLYQGLKKEDTLNAGDYMTNERVDPATMNIDPTLRANNEGFQGTLNAVRSGAGGSGGSYLANMQQAQLNKQKGDANAFTQKSNYDNQQRVSADMANIRLDQQNNQIKRGVHDNNARAKAAREGALGDAASNIAGLSAANTQTKADAYGFSKMAGMYDYMFNKYVPKNKKEE